MPNISSYWRTIWYQTLIKSEIFSAWRNSMSWATQQVACIVKLASSASWHKYQWANVRRRVLLKNPCSLEELYKLNHREWHLILLKMLKNVLFLFQVCWSNYQSKGKPHESWTLCNKFFIIDIFSCFKALYLACFLWGDLCTHILGGYVTFSLLFRNPAMKY